MGYDNKNTPRERESRNRTPEWRPRSAGRERTPGRGQSPGYRSRPRSSSHQRYDQPYSRQTQRPRSASRDSIKGCLRCGGDHKAEKCTLEYSAEKCPTGCGYRNRIVQGRNHLQQGNQDRALVQTWRIEGIEPQAAGLLVILEMTKDRSTVKWLVLGVLDTVSFADDREVMTKDHQTRPNLGLGKGGPLVGQQQDQLTEYRLWQ